MNPLEMFKSFEQGCFYTLTSTKALMDVAWKEHPTFCGVFLKEVLSLEAGGGKFSLHLVRLNPGAAIGLHVHPKSIELHEVIAGSGSCLLNGKELAYTPGSMALIACGVEHQVQAGEQGPCLFAKFIY